MPIKRRASLRALLQDYLPLEDASNLLRTCG